MTYPKQREYRVGPRGISRPVPLSGSQAAIMRYEPGSLVWLTDDEARKLAGDLEPTGRSRRYETKQLR